MNAVFNLLQYSDGETLLLVRVEDRTGFRTHGGVQPMVSPTGSSTPPQLQARSRVGPEAFRNQAVASDEGVRIDPKIAAETMKGWRP